MKALKEMLDEVKTEQDILREDRRRLIEENEKLKWQNGRQKDGLEKLTEEAAGWKQLYGTALTVLETVIAEQKPTEAEPLSLPTEAVNDTMQSGGRLVIDYDPEKQIWKMWLKEEQGEE